MRLLVCGGRDFSDRPLLYAHLDLIDVAFCIDLIIEGEASGADRMAREYAQERGIPFWGFPAKWDDIDRPGAVVKRTRTGRLYDAAAGSIRNTRMLVEGQPTHCLSAPGGSGTADMIAQCERYGITPWALSDRLALLRFLH